MRFLRTLGFGPVNARLRGPVGVAVAVFDELPGLFLRGGGYIQGIRAHIGDEARRACLAQFHTFVELLGNDHGFDRGIS